MLTLVLVTGGLVWVIVQFGGELNAGVLDLPGGTRPPIVLQSGISPEQVEQRQYREYVRECLETLMTSGTDHYGSQSRPLLVSILDVRDLKCPEAPDSRAFPWRGWWRRGFWKPRGADLLSDQVLVELFYLFTAVTDDPRYEQFARAYLTDALGLKDAKGLLWWGWHRFYDVYKDELGGSDGLHHEIHVIRPRWRRLWEVDPATTREAIEAIWTWHVVNKETGEHNRHGDGQVGCDFAMSAGQYIYAFSMLAKLVNDPSLLDRARLLATYHWTSRHQRTGLIPNRPNARGVRFDGEHFDTSITGIYAYYLLKAFEVSGEQQFREHALALLKAYSRYGYDSETGHFWASLALDGTPETDANGAIRARARGSSWGDSEPSGVIDLWEPYHLGYVYPIYTAQCYAYAYQLTGEPDMLKTAQAWAKWIRETPPESGSIEGTWYHDYSKRFSHYGTYADFYGRTISLFVHLYILTGESWYLDHARVTARQAVSRLYYNGLLRGHPASPFYSSVDGVGYLLYALLQLDRVLQNPHAVIGCKSLSIGSGSSEILGLDNW